MYKLPRKSKGQFEVPWVEGIIKKRRLVLKFTVPSKKAKVKSFSEMFLGLRNFLTHKII